MDRRYRLELQLVRVPVVWKAKVPEKKLFPVTRKVPEERAIRRRNLAAVKMFMARMLEGIPDWLITPQMGLPMNKNPKDEPFVFRRYTPLPWMLEKKRPPWEDE